MSLIWIFLGKDAASRSILSRADRISAAGDRRSSPGTIQNGGSKKRFMAPARERGAQLIEFAVTLPVALGMMTALLSFGVYLNKSLELTNATSIAGQYLATNRGMPGDTDPCATVASAFQNVSPYMDQSSLTFNLTINSTQPTFSGSYPGTKCPAASAGMNQGAVATITVTYPCYIGILGGPIVSNCLLRSQVTEIIQ